LFGCRFVRIIIRVVFEAEDVVEDAPYDGLGGARVVEDVAGDAGGDDGGGVLGRGRPWRDDPRPVGDDLGRPAASLGPEAAEEARRDGADHLRRGGFSGRGEGVGVALGLGGLGLAPRDGAAGSVVRDSGGVVAVLDGLQEALQKDRRPVLAEVAGEDF